MIKGDIDIYVINKKLNKNLSIRVLNKLIILNQFRGFLFYDFVKRRKMGFPKGYYIGLKTNIHNEKWKIDIWFMKSMDVYSDRFMKKIKSKLNKKNKEIIIKLKKQVKDKKIEIPSYLIYKVVIEKNIKTLSDLKLYIKSAN